MNCKTVSFCFKLISPHTHYAINDFQKIGSALHRRHGHCIHILHPTDATPSREWLRGRTNLRIQQGNRDHHVSSKHPQVQTRPSQCGINAPNGMNKQSWEVRIVDNPEFIDGITEVYKKANPKAAEDPSFKNMFRNAPTVAFIAHDPGYDC